MHCLKATYLGILPEQVGRLVKQESDRSCNRSLCHLLDVGPSYCGGCTMQGRGSRRDAGHRRSGMSRRAIPVHRHARDLLPSRSRGTQRHR